MIQKPESLVETAKPLSDKQKKIDVDKDGKIEGEDLKKLRELALTLPVYADTEKTTYASEYTKNLFKLLGIKPIRTIKVDKTLVVAKLNRIPLMSQMIRELQELVKDAPGKTVEMLPLASIKPSKSFGFSIHSALITVNVRIDGLTKLITVDFKPPKSA